MKLHSRRLGLAATAVVIMVTPQSSVSMQQQNEAPYRNRTLPIEKRVEDLLGRMTLDEKIGQMTQADHASLKDATEVDTLFLGSVLSGGDSELPDVSAKAWQTHTETLQKRALGTRLGIPLIYGIDAVHGHSNVRGAVVFPHNIGMGCTRNPKLVEEASAITAREVAGTGMHWNFAPCIAVPQDDRWGRTYEGFGETAELAETLGHRCRARVPGLRHVESRPRAGDREALRRRRRHTQRGRSRRYGRRRSDAPTTSPARLRRGDQGWRRIDHGVVQQLERRKDARQPPPHHRRVERRARLPGHRRLRLERHRRAARNGGRTDRVGGERRHRHDDGARQVPRVHRRDEGTTPKRAASRSHGSTTRSAAFSPSSSGWVCSNGRSEIRRSWTRSGLRSIGPSRVRRSGNHRCS